MPVAARTIGTRPRRAAQIGGLFHLSFQKRITAILSYHPEPDRAASPEKNCRLYGPRVEKILAARENR